MFIPSWSLFQIKQILLLSPEVFPQTSFVLLCFLINLSHYCLCSSSRVKIFLVSEPLQLQGLHLIPRGINHLSDATFNCLPSRLPVHHLS